MSTPSMADGSQPILRSQRWKIGDWYAEESMRRAEAGQYQKAYFCADEARRQRERAIEEDRHEK